MESYGHGYGYIAYQTTLNRDYENAELTFEPLGLGDRAQIYINKEMVGVLYVNDDKLAITFNCKNEPITVHTTDEMEKIYINNVYGAAACCPIFLYTLSK